MGKGLEMEKRGCCCWESWLPSRDAKKGSVKEAERRLARVRSALRGARARQTDRQDGAWNGRTRVPGPNDSRDLPVQYHFCSLEHLVEVTRSCLDLSRGVTCLHLGLLRPSFAVVVCLVFFFLSY